MEEEKKPQGLWGGLFSGIKSMVGTTPEKKSTRFKLPLDRPRRQRSESVASAASAVSASSATTATSATSAATAASTAAAAPAAPSQETTDK